MVQFGCPDISIIVPVYNCERFIHSLFDPLLEDAELGLEIIAIDDGSSDGSLSILQEYSARDGRVRVLQQRNRGPGAARNAGLSAARGEWIAFADADDLVSGRNLRFWMEQARSQGAEVVIGNAFLFSEEAHAAMPTKPLLTAQPWDEVISGETWICHCVHRQEWPHYVWLQLIKR